MQVIHIIEIASPSIAGGSKKAEQDNVSGSLEDDEIKETKAGKKLNQSICLQHL